MRISIALSAFFLLPVVMMIAVAPWWVSLACLYIGAATLLPVVEAIRSTRSPFDCEE